MSKNKLRLEILVNTDTNVQESFSEGKDLVIFSQATALISYTGDPPSTEQPVGPYHTVVIQTSGRTVLVVQDFALAKHLGYLNVTFDDKGEVTGWSGNPILLDNSVVEGK